MPSKRPAGVVSGRPSGIRYGFDPDTALNGRSTTSMSLCPADSTLWM
jgi:hypothetical protein